LAVAPNAQGTVDDIKVARSLDASLDQASIDAVKQWKFNPATKDGKPVAVQFEAETQFRLY
jgi:periplasmic protein TonB